LPSLAKILIILSISSIWQAISGYADVFSHRFVFARFDPPLNPAHLSLYSASLVGLVAIWLGLRARRREAKGFGASLGLHIALVGGGVELFAGLINEVYHQVVIYFFNNNALHFAIHGLFVISMLVVALGGLVATTSLLAQSPSGSLVRSSSIFLSSIWLLTIGSVSYVAASAGEAAGYAYLLSGALVAAAIVTSVLPVIDRFGAIVLPSVLFLIVTGGLIYFFTQGFAFLPYTVIAALAVELVWRGTRGFGMNGLLLTGASLGLLSYWLLYPYSFVFFGSGALPTSDVVAPLLGAAVTGMLGAALGAITRNYVADFVRSSTAAYEQRLKAPAG
jgi:hypothetical protein